MISLLQAMDDPNLFGRWFSGPSWDAWRVFIAALFGIPYKDSFNNGKPNSTALFTQATGRTLFPKSQHRECFAICGRRAGKSHIASLIAVYLSCFRDYSKHLSPGERATVMVISADRKQSRTVMRYILGLLENVPLLSTMMEHVTRETIDLNNGITIEVHVCNYRSTRGYTVAAVIADELAYWRSDESASPDHEVLNSLRPAMTTLPGSLLLAISSPYKRSGALHDSFRRHWGHYGQTLIWKADTATMNPTIDKGIIDAAYEEDAARASSEYGGEFRQDIEALFSQEGVEAAVVPHRYELPREPNVAYYCATDPSGGSSDSWTLAIAHNEDGRVVLDAIRERKPPFSPEDVAKEYSELASSYGCPSVSGDRYGGQFPVELFAKYGVNYRPADKTTSELYLELVAQLNGSKIVLLDHPKLCTQLVLLERRTGRVSGKDAVTHPVHTHDDLATALAGVAYLARQRIPINPDDWEWGEPHELESAAILTGQGYETEHISLQDF